MANQSFALVRSGSRAPKSVHFVQWTAQIVIGVRSLRRMANEGNEAFSVTKVASDARTGEPPALPQGGNGGH
jgi:hypothetical protein